MVSKMCADPLSYVQERPPHTHTHQPVSAVYENAKLNNNVTLRFRKRKKKNQRVKHDVNEVLRKSTKREKGMYMFTLFQNYNEDPGILHICFCQVCIPQSSCPNVFYHTKDVG